MTAEACATTDLSLSAERKYAAMLELLRPLRRVAVAFSAGVDSTFVLKAAIDALGRENVVAVTGRSDSLAQAEFQTAVELADSLQARHVVIDTEEFQNPDYLANPVNRCYFCKTTLYAHIEKLAADMDLGCIVNGANADDLGDWRPGMDAARERQVRSPAAEVGLTKAEIRLLSQRMGLPTFDKPASPCLSSRIPYGEPVTPEKLRMIEAGESFLHRLGFRECRVRHHGNMARIEVPPDQIEQCAQEALRAEIDAGFRKIGYAYVALDLRGFRSGAMNEVIAFGKVQT